MAKAEFTARRKALGRRPQIETIRITVYNSYSPLQMFTPVGIAATGHGCAHCLLNVLNGSFAHDSRADPDHP